MTEALSHYHCCQDCCQQCQQLWCHHLNVIVFREYKTRGTLPGAPPLSGFITEQLISLIGSWCNMSKRNLSVL